MNILYSWPTMSSKGLVAVVLNEETLVRIDALRPLLDSAWRAATRSDVLRLVILAGLGHYEKKHRAKLGATTRRGRRGAEEPATSRRKRAPTA